MSVSISGSSKCSGWFLVGPGYDSMISQREKCNTDIHQMLVQLCFISYGQDPAVVGRSDWMRRRHTQTTNRPSKPSIQTAVLYFLMLSLSYGSVHPPTTTPLVCGVVVVVVVCMHGASASVWVCVSERPRKLQHACVTLLCIQACMCVFVCVWVRVCGSWHGSRPIGRLSSHQDVPTGPSLGRVPGLSPACVLAECCQIIPHTWKLAWRWSYPPFTLNLPLSPPPTLPEAPPSSWPTRPEIGRTSSGVPAIRTDSRLYLLHLLCPTLTGLDMHTQDLHWHPNLSCISITARVKGKIPLHMLVKQLSVMSLVCWSTWEYRRLGSKNSNLSSFEWSDIDSYKSEIELLI